MKTLWIALLLLGTCGLFAKAQFEDEYDDYANYDDLDDLDKMIDEEINESLNKKTDIENDLKVEEEIQQFREADGEKLDAAEGPKDTVDDIRDYQFEDNRDKSAENEDKNLSVADNVAEDEELANNLENRPEPDDPNAPNQNEDYALLWNDDSIAPAPETVDEDENQNILEVTKQILAKHDNDEFDEEIKNLLETINDSKESTEEDKAIIEETKQILAEQDTDKFEEEIQKEIEKLDLNPSEQEKAELDKIVQETKQLLAGNFDTFDNDDKDVQGDVVETADDEETENAEQVDDGDDKQENVDDAIEDNVDDVENGDDTIQENVDDVENGDDTIQENVNDAILENDNDDKQENVDEANPQDQDDDTVDKVYADLNADLDKLFATLDKLKDDTSDNSADNEDFDKALEEADKMFADLDDKEAESSDELVENNKYEDVDLDKILEEILNEDDMKSEDTAAEVLEPLVNDALNEPNPEDANEKDIESIDRKVKPIEYLNDAVVDEPKENAETLENLDENNANEDVKDASIEKHVETALVDELNSSELEELVSQFAMLHSEDLDMHSEDFNKDVAPVHITLKLDEPTVITSPNYPMAYPTNNIVDWILDGPGEGIEFNITEFAVNGALGDYVLVKPGGVDDSGHEGLLFTYRLTSPRRYRFTDVNRLFMRFESKPGAQFFRGFSLSAKLIAPIPTEVSEPIPEPEAVVAPPHSTATVTLAISAPLFDEVKEPFRELLADMAEEFLKEYDVEPGLNSTSEVTQITNVGLCPMTWPDFESCTAVTFGVSLVYEDADLDPRLDEDDLRTMWTTYVNRDPYAIRLRAMGLAEFYGPNSAAMTAWLVIAGGVVLSMAMLAFVLWRYSCFEGYTRMKPFSDTDSLHNEKRNLDLYPTPHQTLPPLYADTQHEYKWPEDDTRVDMGGFANRSYTENMYDFDSDEDVIPTRDRQNAAANDYSSNV